MKKVVVIFVLCISILESRPLAISVSYEDKATYPFCVGQGSIIDLEKPGVAIEAMKMVEKKLDVKFSFKREVGVRGQKKLKYNKVDMLLFASFSEDRKVMGVFPTKPDGTIDTDRRAMNLSYHLYTLKESKLDWDGKKFMNLTGEIGATKGYSIVKFLEERGVKVSENNSNLGDPKKLLANRIQGFVIQDSKIDPFLNENPDLKKQIKKINTPLKTKAYYMIFSHKFYKENQELANKIWDELKQLEVSEKFKTIREKY